MVESLRSDHETRLRYEYPESPRIDEGKQIEIEMIQTVPRSMLTSILRYPESGFWHFLRAVRKTTSIGTSGSRHHRAPPEWAWCGAVRSVSSTARISSSCAASQWSVLARRQSCIPQRGKVRTRDGDLGDARNRSTTRRERSAIATSIHLTESDQA